MGAFAVTPFAFYYPAAHNNHWEKSRKSRGSTLVLSGDDFLSFTEWPWHGCGYDDEDHENLIGFVLQEHFRLALLDRHF